MKKIIISLTITVILSALFSSITNSVPNSYFLNTMYTVSGIMFSIGMGVICTFIPNKVKNKKYYNIIKNDINKIRNSYVAWFAAVTIIYSTYQILENWQFNLNFSNLQISFNLSFLCFFFTILSICYFCINFFGIQKLIFDIAEKIESEEG